MFGEDQPVEVSASGRIDYCGECCRPINIANPKKPIHSHDGSPLCPARKPVNYIGATLLEIPYDAKTMKKILASPADPRDSNNWTHHPASDGNKGYKTWNPK